MKSFIVSLLDRIDQKGSGIYLKLFGEKNSLIILLFHSLFKDQNEMAKNLIAPQQGTTVDHFRQIIEHFQANDYLFATPDEIIAGLDESKRYVLLTFDDGYFNNVRALPVLEEYGAQATFYISTDHVLKQKSFWWDSLHRNADQLSMTQKALVKFKNDLKTKTTADIESIVAEKFGSDSLKPIADTDRPLTTAELKDFSNHQCVTIGNHTADHAILTNYTTEEAAKQIADCQSVLTEITGRTPNSISYPNGNHSPEVVEVAKQAGIKIGITGIRRKNYTPLEFDGHKEMHLGRMVPYGNWSIKNQCNSYRADFGFYGMIKNVFNGMKKA